MEWRSERLTVCLDKEFGYDPGLEAAEEEEEEEEDPISRGCSLAGEVSLSCISLGDLNQGLE